MAFRILVLLVLRWTVLQSRLSDAQGGERKKGTSPLFGRIGTPYCPPLTILNTRSKCCIISSFLCCTKKGVGCNTTSFSLRVGFGVRTWTIRLIFSPALLTCGRPPDEGFGSLFPWFYERHCCIPIRFIPSHHVDIVPLPSLPPDLHGTSGPDAGRSQHSLSWVHNATTSSTP